MFFQKIALPLLLAICCLLACQKDEIPSNSNPNSPPTSTVIPNPNLAGDFYTYRTRMGGLSDAFTNTYSNWRDTADAIINGALDGDTLAILGFRLKVDSSNQMVFNYADGTGIYGVTAIKVRYTNNYDSIYVEYKTPCGSAGNCSTINYSGEKGGVIHRPNNGSVYTLQVVEYKTQFVPPSTVTTLIDTQYTKDISIQYANTFAPPVFAPDLVEVRFDLEGALFDVRGFESYYRHKTDASNEWVNQQIYWKNDSFYLREQMLDYANGRSYPADTTYYVYQGRVK